MAWQHTPLWKRVDAANDALEAMSEEWLQRQFGDNAVDVIFDALNLYIETQQKRIAARDKKKTGKAKAGKS